MSHQQKQHSHLSPELHDDGRSLVSRLLVVSLSLLLIIYEHPEKQLLHQTLKSVQKLRLHLFR